MKNWIDIKPHLVEQFYQFDERVYQLSYHHTDKLKNRIYRNTTRSLMAQWQLKPSIVWLLLLLGTGSHFYQLMSISLLNSFRCSNFIGAIWIWKSFNNCSWCTLRSDLHWLLPVTCRWASWTVASPQRMSSVYSVILSSHFFFCLPFLSPVQFPEGLFLQVHLGG